MQWFAKGRPREVFLCLAACLLLGSLLAFGIKTSAGTGTASKSAPPTKSLDPTMHGGPIDSPVAVAQAVELLRDGRVAEAWSLLPSEIKGQHFTDEELEHTGGISAAQGSVIAGEGWTCLAFGLVFENLIADDWVFVVLDAQRQVVAVRRMGLVTDREPELYIGPDGFGLVVCRGEMRGTGMGGTIWHLVNLPKQTAEGGWTDITIVFSGIEKGFTGRWFSEQFQWIAFPDEPVADFVEFDVSYTVRQRDNLFLVTRRGQMWQDQEGADEASPREVNDVLRYDPVYGTLVPAF